MTVKIINPEPDTSVKKEVVCYNCGCRLEYTPMDVREEVIKDYTGCSDTYYRIDCPKCSKVLSVSKY